MDHKKIIETLESHNKEAYYIGGFVRDKLLNKIPLDADIVTSAHPEDIINIFSGLAEVKEVGKSFGVVLVNDIEVATFRKDKYSGLDDKEVEITYSDTLKEDTDRRDLTINAIAMDSKDNIIDYHNGINDLNNKIIRFIGNPKDRIFEDPNRILRACRFLCLIDGIFDPRSFFVLKQYKYLVTFIAHERIKKEIMKVMKIQKASKFFIACYQIGILKYILPSLNDCIGVTQNKYHSEPIFYHSMKVGDSISTKYPLLKLAGYLHDVGKVTSKEFNTEKNDYQFLMHHRDGAKLAKSELMNLKFSNDEIDYVYNMIRYHMRNIPENSRGYRRTLNVFLENNIEYKDFLRIKLADKRGKYPQTHYEIGELKTTLTKFKSVIDNKQPFGLKDLAINGHDLMSIGIKVGPEMGKILNELLNKVIDNPEINTKELLLEEVKR